MLLNTTTLTDLSVNNFGITEVVKTLVESSALHLLDEGRITFDPRPDKTVEMLAMRLMETQGNLDELGKTVMSVAKKKDDAYKNWKGWVDVESGSLEEQVARAVKERLDPGTGEILAVSYNYKEFPGDLDGLVVGELKGEPIYVLIEAKHNMDALMGKAKRQLKISSQCFEELMEDTTEEGEQEGELDQNNLREDRSVLQIERLKGRKRFWAFGGVRFNNWDKLQMDGKNCFIVKPKHEDKCEVVHVYSEDK